MSKWDDMRAAVREARETLLAADSVATGMAAILIGRLRKVDNVNTLRSLKRELAQFNATTGRWQ